MRIDGTATQRLPICKPRAVRIDSERQVLLDREWLITNGLGGYSSGTAANIATRRYHGLLVAAMPNPLGRMVMLNVLDDGLELESLVDFRLEAGVPVWRHELDGRVIEKRVLMPYRQNTVLVWYRNLGEVDVRLTLAPAVHFRNYEASVSDLLQSDYECALRDGVVQISVRDLPPLSIAVDGESRFSARATLREQVLYPMEESRGYQAQGRLWSPGVFEAMIPPGSDLTLTASAEDESVFRALSAPESLEFERERKRRLIENAPPAVRDGHAAQLVIAADQFVIKPVGRQRDTVRAAAFGDELRTVIAGYHWFTDWGRDTMISLEGLTLTTGRHREAGFILRTFAQYVRDGLIPNLFPDGSDDGLYHTADATLWFFHALDRYGSITGYWTLVAQVMPVLRSIVDAHLEGTHFGIGVDPKDGLLRQGEEGYQLTWMDAKVDGWVVTPRRGKAVEINALWYNALCLASRWERALGGEERAVRYEKAALRARNSFNERFWSEREGHLFDVVDGPDGDDGACRPNQIFAISLPNPVLKEKHWPSVLHTVKERLLTPVGLRSLAPGHPDYKPKYFGDLRTRDAAYHQGTVWGWLIGPFVDAWLRVHPDDKAGARRFLDGLIEHLPEYGVGSIAEIFDADAPFTPRGCVAQAWSVAEVLRCLEKTS